jgi:hypothetical protein
MVGMTFEMNDKNLENFKTTLRMFPKEAKKAVAQCLNDEARLFKDLAPKIIGQKYTLRNKAFINARFKVEKANPNDPIEKQYANSIIHNENLGGGSFSAFEEELTGAPRMLRKGSGQYHRTMTEAARGGHYGNQVIGKYRLRPDRLTADGHNSDFIPDSRNYPHLKIPQFIAMIAKSDATGRSKRAKHFKEKDYAIGKNKVFIMGGPEAPLGLYALNEGKVQRMQYFKKTPPAAEKFDWQQMTIDKVFAWFSPSEIWKQYFEPLWEKFWK